MKRFIDFVKSVFVGSIQAETVPAAYGCMLSDALRGYSI